MAIVLRSARPDDAAEIARLTLQLGYAPPLERVTAGLSRALARPGDRFLMADLDGRAVGWVHAVLIDHYVDVEPFVLVAGLVVDSTVRREGIGLALMTQVEKWATEQRCGAVRLASSSTRTAAHRFYEGIGYTNIKTQYAFAKPLDGDAASLHAFVPTVD